MLQVFTVYRNIDRSNKISFSMLAETFLLAKLGSKRMKVHLYEKIAVIKCRLLSVFLLESGRPSCNEVSPVAAGAGCRKPAGPSIYNVASPNEHSVAL